jgi:transglutaminase-like putative cysteine protease
MTGVGQRTVEASLELSASGPSAAALAIAVADSYDVREEELRVRQDGRELDSRVVVDRHGTRVHVVDLDRAGTVSVEYRAVVGTGAPEPVSELDEWRYLRPSRYCESDTLGPFARGEFPIDTPAETLAAVSSWVGTHLSYVPGSSEPTDGAVSAMLARRGVCRDYAHLVVALLRALGIPARVVSVYAPGLDPMDFHAVAEAAIDGRWCAVDATTLAPRRALIRIATGRDASDTAFLSVRGSAIGLESMRVVAVADELPGDDITELVAIA